MTKAMEGICWPSPSRQGTGLRMKPSGALCSPFHSRSGSPEGSTLSLAIGGTLVFYLRVS